MSFSCPHFDPSTNWCDRVHDECVCGRPGCVLAKNSVFAVDPQVRLAESRLAQQKQPGPDNGAPKPERGEAHRLFAPHNP
ncbi:MAG: hypothetical protein WC661_10610 [Opitutaceae bacterium]|jgi:hypothetical protein